MPIMLAYVYGVVPISLCRGGGCGVSTANGKGVKIEFDEDDGPITGSVMGRAKQDPLTACCVEETGACIAPRSEHKLTSV